MDAVSSGFSDMSRFQSNFASLSVSFNRVVTQLGLDTPDGKVTAVSLISLIAFLIFPHLGLVGAAAKIVQAVICFAPTVTYGYVHRANIIAEVNQCFRRSDANDVIFEGN